MDFNFWNSSIGIVSSLSSTSYTWSGLDCKETYASLDPSLLTYKDTDFKYVRNKHSFRSDNFNNDDPVKILYAGCSYTEGIGVPREHTWASFLNERISKDIEKEINHYNIGMGCLSIDSIVRLTYLTISSGLFKPDAIFFLFPGPERNEYIMRDGRGVSIYHFIPTFVETGDPAKRVLHSNVLKTMTLEQRVHETYRNLLFLKMFLELKGIRWYFSTWDTGHGPDDPRRSVYRSAPPAIREHYIESFFIYDKYHERADVLFDCPFEKKFKEEIGRDGQHPGPNSHWNFTKKFYNELKDKQVYRELVEKWKS